MSLSRRQFVAGSLCACCMGDASATATHDLRALTPLITRDYVPQDKDERGLWDSCNRLEQELIKSNLLIKDAGLHSYLFGVLQRLLPDLAGTLRLYPM